MKKVVQRRIRREGDGIQLAADVHAVVATNTGRPGAATTTATTASNRQQVRIVQRGGKANRSGPDSS